MEKPLDGMNLPSAPGERVIDKPELPAGGIATDQEVYTEVIEGEMHLKVGKYRHFEVYSDEAQRIGGHRTKKATVNEALKEYIARRLQLKLVDLFGTVEWDPDHDYKRERGRR